MNRWAYLNLRRESQVIGDDLLFFSSWRYWMSFFEERREEIGMRPSTRERVRERSILYCFLVLFFVDRDLCSNSLRWSSTRIAHESDPRSSSHSHTTHTPQWRYGRLSIEHTVVRMTQETRNTSRKSKEKEKRCVVSCCLLLIVWGREFVNNE